MHERGWKIDVDGAYGPGSERVCRDFQEEEKLEVDGAVGPKTWEATWAAPVTEPKPPPKG
jgi:peptidoglycan hydrolase-like protein with peptidoglycan-binding domain